MKVLTPEQAAKVADGRAPVRNRPPRRRPRRRQPRNWGRCAARPEKLHLGTLVRCADCGQFNPNI